MNEAPCEKLQIIAAKPGGNLTEKDRLAIELRFAGTSSDVIAEKCGYSSGSYVRQLFEISGRLRKPYEEYAARQHSLATTQADQVLELARKEAGNAVKRIIDLSKSESINEAVQFKANEFLLQLSGALQGATLEAFFAKKSFEQVKAMVDEAAVKIFGKPMSGFQLMIENPIEAENKALRPEILHTGHRETGEK